MSPDKTTFVTTSAKLELVWRNESPKPSRKKLRARLCIVRPMNSHDIAIQKWKDQRRAERLRQKSVPA